MSRFIPTRSEVSVSLEQLCSQGQAFSSNNPFTDLQDVTVSTESLQSVKDFILKILRALKKLFTETLNPRYHLNKRRVAELSELTKGPVDTFEMRDFKTYIKSGNTIPFSYWAKQMKDYATANQALIKQATANIENIQVAFHVKRPAPKPAVLNYFDLNRHINGDDNNGVFKFKENPSPITINFMGVQTTDIDAVIEALNFDAEIKSRAIRALNNAEAILEKNGDNASPEDLAILEVCVKQLAALSGALQLAMVSEMGELVNRIVKAQKGNKS